MENIKENPRFVTMPQVHPAQVDCLCDVPGYLYMKEIPLTQGKIVLVDDDDFDFLMQWKWHFSKGANTHYAVRKVHFYLESGKRSCRTIPMHRIIMNAPNGMEVDHINRNGLDNRKQNLRIVTHRENSWNKINKRKYPGVYKQINRFAARIRINDENIFLGSFMTELEAHEKYMEIANKLKNDINQTKCFRIELEKQITLF